MSIIMNEKSNSFIELVRDQTDIIDLISEYVLLTPKGRYYSGLCPFHQEKTPSFTVTPDKKIFYCFGCGTGGDVFSFLMKKEGISFPEALNKLAIRANIQLSGHKGFAEKKQLTELKTKIYDLNRTAAGFFYVCLTRTKDGKNALDYLFKRGIKNEIIRHFGLGYAPNSWSTLYDYLINKGFEEQLIEKAGLIISKKNKNGYYDRFRNRIMYPIFDLKGRVCGFGGRALGEEQPKYFNSPETPVFSKSKILYGLNLAREEIKKKGSIILMEGYMDVLTAHQAGCNTAVASLGTALTSQQCRLLLSLAPEIIFIYDSDQAGVRAALKGIETLREFNLTLKVCSLPHGTDPDDYIREYGGDQFLALVDQAIPFYDFQIQTILQNNNLNLQGEKIRAIKSVLPVLLSIKDINLRDEYIKKVVDLFDIPEENLRLQLKQSARTFPPGGRGNFSQNSHTNKKQPSQQVLDAPYKMLSAPLKAQRGLLKLIINKKGSADYIRSELELEHFVSNEYRGIFNKFFLLKEQSGEVEIDKLFDLLTEEEKQICAGLLTVDDESLEMEEKLVQDYIKCLQTNREQFKIDQLQKEIEICEREGRQEELLQLLEQLHRAASEIKT